MNKKLIVIANLAAISIWFFFATTDEYSGNEKRYLQHLSASIEGVLVDCKMRRSSSNIGAPVMVYCYSFTVNGKPYTNTVTFTRGSEGDRTIRHVPTDGPLSILYDQNDPSVNMPADVARFYQTNSPRHLETLLQSILLVNAVVVFLMWYARYRAAN